MFLENVMVMHSTPNTWRHEIISPKNTLEDAFFCLSLLIDVNVKNIINMYLF
jgi:hypothetical protein